MEIEIDRIVIKPRFRVHIGDLAPMMESIRRIGVLQPIGVDKDNVLVFGERRVEACRRLGMKTIPARIIDMDALEAEHDENECRLNFSMSERVAIGRAIEERYGERRGGDKKSKAKNLAFDPNAGNKTDSIAAKQAGFGNPETYRQAKRVVDQGAPELVAAVDAGAVSISAAATIAEIAPIEQTQIIAKGESEILKAAKEIREKKAQSRREEIAAQKAQEQPQLPDGRYETIVIDPPWEMQKIVRDVRPNQVAFEYPTMSESELADFDVPSISADDSHLFCWTTHKHLPMALRLVERWGYRYVCTMVWHKPGGFQPIGLPQYNCEFIVYARRGSPSFVDTKSFNCCFPAMRREHSRKPDEFYGTIRRVTAGPRIDVFSRESREGFDAFGDEAGKFDEAAS